MKQIQRKIHLAWLLPALLVVMVGILAWANYQPGTYLTGWDTLQPEFNLSLYAKRALWGGWMEHQGLGAPPSQAHAAELVRLPFLWLLDLILPQNAIRYSFFFLTWLVGVLGMYRLGLSLTKSKAAAFGAAVYYLLNLTTLQHMYVPLEMFAVQFATIPWLMERTITYLRCGGRKVLLGFGLWTLLGAPMAHTPTLWLVWFGLWGLFCLVWWLVKPSKLVFKRILVLGGLTLAINAFWLMPSLYYIVTQSETVRSAAITRLFSDEAMLQSQNYGTTENLILMRNFLFNWREYDFDNLQYVELMDEWQAHLDQPIMMVIGYLIFGVVVLGWGVCLRRKKRIALSLTAIWFVATFFWLNANPPTGWLFNLVQKALPLLQEALRFPYTKFSIPLLMVQAAFITLGLAWLLNKLKRKWVGVVMVGVWIGLLIYYMWPAYKGNLISPSMKVAIPAEYQQLFSWFNEQDTSARVAKLPLHSMWGWVYHNWGYQGAGFTWFGISQPTLDREFDRWGEFNEGFYLQARRAIDGRDMSALEQVLTKYQVGYLLLDESVVDPNQKPIDYEELKGWLTASAKFQAVARFGFLQVYAFKDQVGELSVSAPPVWRLETGGTGYEANDPLFATGSVYVNSDRSVIYPFVGLSNRAGTQTVVKGQNVRITQQINLPSNAVIKTNAPEMTVDQLPLAVYASKEGERLIVWIQPLLPKLVVDGEEHATNQPMFKTILTTGDDQLVYLTVGERTFPIPELTGQPKYVGTITSKQVETIPLAVFGLPVYEQPLLVEAWMNQMPRICNEPDTVLPIAWLEDQLKLDISNDDLCVGHFFTQKYDDLGVVSYLVEETGGAVGDFCITQENSVGCVNEDKPNQAESTGVGRKEVFYVPLGMGGFWLDLVGRHSYGAGSVAFKDVNMKVFPKKASSEVTLRIDQAEVVEQKIEAGTHEVQVQLPLLAAEPINWQEVMNVPVRNCSEMGSGNTVREMSDGGVNYIATDNAVICDAMSFYDLPSAEMFVLHVAGKQVLGRSLKSYVNNLSTKTNDYQELLPKGEYDQAYVFYPVGDLVDGYSLNIEGRSYGRVASDNILYSAEIIPVIWSEWLKSIRVEPFDSFDDLRTQSAQGGFGEMMAEGRVNGDSRLATSEIHNSLQIQNVTKYGTSHYVVETQGVGLLALSQGYDDGWMAISGGKLLPHVKVNGWENGWMIGDSQLETRDSSNNSLVASRDPLSSVFIVYWPQYLEWGGLLLLGIIGAGFLANSAKSLLKSH